ncbi:MAG: DUF5723 family protein [Rikenellaceae bacterium]
MKYFSRLIVAFILTATFSTPAYSQYITTSYFMEQNWQSNMLNPAFAPSQGYVLIPVIGGTSFNVGSNSLTIDKLFYQNPNGSGLVSFLDVDIDKSLLLSAVKDNNNISADFSTTLFGVGFYKNDIFWNFGMNLNVSSDVNIPGGFFDLVALNQADGVYNLSNLNVNASAMLETYVGANFKIGDRLTLGARVKALLGVANVTANYDDLQININDSEWTISANGDFDATGAGLSLDNGTQDFSLENLEYEPEVKFSGFGLGFDLGASFELLDNLTLSMSVLDLGFMNWGKENTISGVSNSDFIYTGATFTDDGMLESESIDLDNIISFDEVEATGRTQSLKTTINIGGEYRFLNDKMAAGLLYSAKFRYGYTKHEVTTVVSGRPFSWFTANLSYSIVAGQLGAALNFHPSWINFFIGTDFIPFKLTPQYLPVSSSNVNVYAGIGIPIGKKRVE